MLWKEKPAKTTAQLEHTQRQQVNQDMEEWMASIASVDDNLKSAPSSLQTFDNLPAVRSSENDSTINTVSVKYHNIQ